MKLSLKIAITATILASVQTIHGPQIASAATSYLSSSTHYAYESFLSSGTWTRPYGVNQIDYLVVAGGGRGGGSQYSTHFAGGGGGGGGVRSGTVSVAQSTYTITVGTGQAVGCSQGRGGSSSLAGSDLTTITATGGGSGACNSNSGGVTPVAGYSGGSGGGGGSQVSAVTFGAGNFGEYSPAEGFAGGSAYAHSSDSRYQGGGGGGGASQSGSSATGTCALTPGSAGCAGKGGDGVASSITGSSVIYGGGGGGGSRSHNNGGAGGAGGGGTGGLNGAQGTAGSDGYGGGGGGTSLSNGNKGGDGVVIVRYVLTAPTTPTFPSASDTGQSSSDRITASTSFSLTGTAIGGSSVQIYNGSSSIGSACTANITTGAYSCALSGLSEGTYTFSAKSSAGGGSSISSVSSITVVIDRTSPSLNPSSGVSVSENQTSITTITSNETVTMQVTDGVDSLTVNFNTSTGVLTFKQAPDYESPSDSNGDRIYVVRIQVTDVAGNWRYRDILITVTNVNEAGTISAPAVSTTTTKGETTIISVTSNVAGTVRFLASGKRISNCLSRPTTGNYPSFTASCYWKPPVTGKQNITAILMPTDVSFASATSSATLVWVVKRSSTR
jgi:hypothetical protein